MAVRRMGQRWQAVVHLGDYQHTRMFGTRREALDWEKDLLLSAAADMDNWPKMRRHKTREPQQYVEVHVLHKIGDVEVIRCPALEGTLDG